MSSPSMVHEGMIALVRDNPAFAARVLRDLLHVDVPRFDVARLTEAALPELVPVEYHADAVVLFEGVVEDKTKPVLGTIFEVQLERKDRKRYTWPFYAVAARARHECPFILTVVTPDAAVARWADQPIELGNGSFAPCVIGPQGIPHVTDRDQAMREPQLAVLSAVAHGKGDESLGLEHNGAVLLENAGREIVRKAMDMDPMIKKFFTDAHRRMYVEGRAEGEAEGKGMALLMILQHRGLATADELFRVLVRRVEPDTLSRWLFRALSVASFDEVFM